MSGASRASQPRLRPPQAPGPHVSGDDLGLFVIDALGVDARRRFERHVMACAACGEALAREAAAEVALQAAWPAVAEVMQPLAPVLSLHPVVVPVVVTMPVVPVPTSAPAPTRRKGARAAGASASWNSFAAAAMTVLFLGYWTDGGRATDAHGRAGFAALDGVLMTRASCGIDEGGDPGLCADASSLACANAGPGARACLAPAAVNTSANGLLSLIVSATMNSSTNAGVCQDPSYAAGMCTLP